MSTRPRRFTLTAIVSVLVAAVLLGGWPGVAPTSVEAAFPGKNGRIAFTSTRDGDSEIYTMKADGSGPRQLTTNTAFDANPAWSPDGKQIAFRSSRDGNSEIYTMAANGGSPKRRTDNPAFDGDPAWSPDGKQIAFTSKRDGNYEIYTMAANGGSPKRRTDNPAFDGHPDWQAKRRR